MNQSFFKRVQGCFFLITACCALLAPPLAKAQTFTNPFFTSQDPWVTYVGGFYYYSESDGGSVWVRKSTTLTGLATAPAIRVFIPVAPDHNREVWAPEVHYVRGAWYIYYAADDGNNANHRLYVAQADSADAQGTYTDRGKLVEASDYWAIDPNVIEINGTLYILWSGTENRTAAFPQNIYIASMSDPLRISSAKVMIATPTEGWEKRTAAIDEGPTIFQNGGKTYVTFSGSASWTTDYTVGLLSNTDGNLLNAASWTKTGPIFDHHSTAYGPGSVVFTTSPDGTEMWNLYHGIDSPTCNPSYTCRNLRLQKMGWNADSSPLLGFPVNPGVALRKPSGENGPFGWGASVSGTAVSGTWNITSTSAASSASLGSGWHQQFRGTTAPIDYTAQAGAQWVQTGTTSAFPKYGIYVCYKDASNYVTAWIDKNGLFYTTFAVLAGVSQSWQNTALPGGFNASLFHTISATKADSLFTFYLDGVQQQQRVFTISNGQAGLVTEDTTANYQSVSVTDNSQGWGNAFGDAAEGSSNGMKAGDWTINSAASVNGTSLGSGWMTLYRGEPNFSYYTVSSDATWVQTGTTSAYPKFGVTACYNDSANFVMAFLDYRSMVYATYAVVGGTAQAWQNTALATGFNTGIAHNIKVMKAGSVFTFYLDGTQKQKRTFNILNGQPGLVTEDTKANYANFTVTRQAVP